MAALSPIIRGSLAAHPAAPGLVAEVLRVHRRYATEVVQAFGLCPFTRDVDVAFGRVCVMLDREPDLEATREAVLLADNPVLHVIFPCALPPPSAFERFANKLLTSLRPALPSPPVMAAFHPQLAGDTDEAYRLIGLLRRAPDPFVQFIPAGVHEGGTMFAEAAVAPIEDGQDRAEQTFQRLRGELLERLFAIAADIRRDRDESYAPHLAALG
jgi:hypothetical protein